MELKETSIPGLGLLEGETEFLLEKATHQASATVQGGPGWLSKLSGMQISGYEIHMGSTAGRSPWIVIDQRSGQSVCEPDGDCSPDGRIWGCYLHGLFASSPFRQSWLRSLGWRGSSDSLRHEDLIMAAFDELADAVEEAVDMQQLEKIIWEG